MKDKIYVIDCPGFMEEWDYENNVGIDPNKTTYKSNKKISWICKYGHRWKSMLNNRSKLNSQCPKCKNANYGKTLADFPDLMLEWDWENNNKLNPEKLSFSTHVKVWWKCKENHIWEMAPHQRTREKPQGCPYCSGRRASPTNNLLHLYPEICKYLDEPNIDPSTISPYSHTPLTWKCDKGHRWKVRSSSLISGSWCPCCAKCGSKKQVCFENSLANIYPELAEQFSKNNSITVDQVLPGSITKYLWLCNKCGNEWWASPNARKTHERGCSYCCKSDGEKTIYNLLKHYNIDFIDEYKPKNLKYQHQLRYDFAIFDSNVLACIIEFNGQQHHINTFGDKVKFNKQKIRDGIKKQYIIDNAISLLEIDYLEIDILEEKVLNFLQELNLLPKDNNND